MLSNNPSVSFADSSPYTGEPTAAAGLLNGISLFGTTCLAGGFRVPIKIRRITFYDDTADFSAFGDTEELFEKRNKQLR
ncbi:MAG: hypothetical protein IJF13_09725 [Clostridia bacterium]|nr:hypothetical protein [Clostridia bacterium]